MKVLIVAPIIFIAFIAHANASSADCRDAIDQLSSARSDAESKARHYKSCTENTSTSDNCSSEFYDVERRQRDLESAVSNYRNSCS